MSPAVTDGLGADDDEPSGEIHAPLPIHERTWVHPSELGAMSAAERSRASDGVRRTGAAVALASVVLSLVFVQAVNSSRRASPRVRAVVAQPVSPTVGASRSPHRMVGAIEGTGQPVVAIDDGATIVAPAGLGNPGSAVPVTFGEVRFIAIVLEDLAPPNLQFLRLEPGDELLAGSAPTVAPVADTAPEPDRGDAMTVHGANASIGTAVVGIASGALHPLVPVDPGPDHPISGGPAFDADGQLLGWVVEWNGAHVLIPVAELLDAVHRLPADARRP